MLLLILSIKQGAGMLITSLVTSCSLRGTMSAWHKCTPSFLSLKHFLEGLQMGCSIAVYNRRGAA